MNANRLLDYFRGRGVSIETDGEHLLIARVIGILKFEQRFQNANEREQDDGRRRRQVQPLPSATLPFATPHTTSGTTSLLKTATRP